VHWTVLTKLQIMRNDEGRVRVSLDSGIIAHYELLFPINSIPGHGHYHGHYLGSLFGKRNFSSSGALSSLLTTLSIFTVKTKVL
jgi:hypothetical protein